MGIVKRPTKALIIAPQLGEQLLLEVAERDFESFDRSIDVHISSLRRKLGDDPKSARLILTIRSAGYMLQKPEP